MKVVVLPAVVSVGEPPEPIIGERKVVVVTFQFGQFSGVDSVDPGALDCDCALHLGEPLPMHGSFHVTFAAVHSALQEDRKRILWGGRHVHGKRVSGVDAIAVRSSLAIDPFHVDSLLAFCL